jgi:hypothetical protein
MTWSAPMTAVAGATFTASQFNQYVRDNLNETAPAKATTASQLFVSTAANAIATRVPSQASILTSEATASTSYTDLATPGPAVTVTCGTIAIVSFAASMSNSGANQADLVSVAVSGVSSVAASDNWSIVADGLGAGQAIRVGMTHFFTGLTGGSNTFTMKYRAGSGTSTFLQRELSVIPL